LKEKEQEFLNRIESHKGILYKVSKMYMDNPDDQQDLFQEIICQLWKSYDSFRNESDSHIKESQIDHFYKAVQKLEKIDKAIIFYQLEGFSHKEIGENLGISEGNARVKLNRAKEKLKEIIKNQGYGF
jgi:DNA-directed RNA polymerase specialized sigma24 family protein